MSRIQISKISFNSCFYDRDNWLNHLSHSRIKLFFFPLMNIFPHLNSGVTRACTYKFWGTYINIIMINRCCKLLDELFFSLFRINPVIIGQLTWYLASLKAVLDQTKVWGLSHLLYTYSHNYVLIIMHAFIMKLAKGVFHVSIPFNK